MGGKRAGGTDFDYPKFEFLNKLFSFSLHPAPPRGGLELAQEAPGDVRGGMTPRPIIYVDINSTPPDQKDPWQRRVRARVASHSRPRQPHLPLRPSGGGGGARGRLQRGQRGAAHRQDEEEVGKDGEKYMPKYTRNNLASNLNQKEGSNLGWFFPSIDSGIGKGKNVLFETNAAISENACNYDAII